MASFLRRLILDVGANEIRVAEVVPDKSGAPVFSQLRSLGLGVDPTKPAEFFPALLAGVETLVKGAGL
ncbi:MAG: hypothetical protein WCJ23_05040, partial [Verrucomicrobiota bacterium]